MYEIHFIPKALVIRWIAWICFFDFEVKHIPGKKYTAADDLSKREVTEEKLEKTANE